MSAHTPGPWSLHRAYVDDKPLVNSDGWEFHDMPIAQGDRIVAIATYWQPAPDQGWPRVESDEEMLANARLIAAAPELLAALKWSETIVHGYFHAENSEERNHYAFDMEHALKTMRVAIARAEGRTT